MALRPLTDVSPADWFVDSDADWWAKVILGPPGFEAYARVLYPLEGPKFEAASNINVVVHAELREVIALHTSTPDDCYFALWDGTGINLRGGRQDIGLRHAVPLDAPPSEVLEAKRLTAAAQLVDYAPAFAPSFLNGPKVSVPNRDFYLLTGPLGEPFGWGAADYAPGVPRDLPDDPGLMWPADHAWFAAADVDPDWIGIGGSQALIDELIADPRFDAVPATYGPNQPECL